MTPGARVAAAIEVLDRILDGVPAEKALTGWARGSRFAGSKDRAAVRDHVFDALRSKRSLAAIGGARTGRALMIGLLYRGGASLEDLFSGDGYAPAGLTGDERAQVSSSPKMSADEACDIPGWLWPHWVESLGDGAQEVGATLQTRAPVFLRVNQQHTNQEAAIDRLAADGVVALPHPQVETCLRVIENERRIKTSAAYLEGLVELQDAASQAAVLRLPLRKGARVLDYCAGGGGKALAIADIHEAEVFAHDIDSTRMRDLPERAARAGVSIKILETMNLPNDGPYDAVFCDAPCSGAGTWRRAPDAKWRLTQDALDQLQESQIAILRSAAPLVTDGGILVYATCSVLACENEEITSRFLQESRDWEINEQMATVPNDDHDGFFMSWFTRVKQP